MNHMRQNNIKQQQRTAGVNCCKLTEHWWTVSGCSCFIFAKAAIDVTNIATWATLCKKINQVRSINTKTAIYSSLMKDTVVLSSSAGPCVHIWCKSYPTMELAVSYNCIISRIAKLFSVIFPHICAIPTLCTPCPGNRNAV